MEQNQPNLESRAEIGHDLDSSPPIVVRRRLLGGRALRYITDVDIDPLKVTRARKLVSPGSSKRLPKSSVSEMIEQAEVLAEATTILGFGRATISTAKESDQL